MRQIVIPGTKMNVSRFIFGTDRLFSLGPQHKRIALLDKAVEAGFSHFDTAPYYGFGFAERDLAPVLKRYGHVTVTTKVGIYPAGGLHQSALSVLIRKAGGRLLPTLSRPIIDFSLKRAQAALEGSLLRLGRERVDLYTLHAPRPHMLSCDEWRRWLEDMRQQGKVGAFGMALTASDLESFLTMPEAPLEVIQVEDSLGRHEADVLLRHGRELQITFGYVRGARQAGDTTDFLAVLAGALDRNRYGAIIVTTSKEDRLGQYARLLEQAT